MNVKELIDLLKTAPQDIRVVQEKYQDGSNIIIGDICNITLRHTDTWGGVLLINNTIKTEGDLCLQYGYDKNKQFYKEYLLGERI